MRRVRIDPRELGFTDEEIATAGRVAVAIHAAARAAVPEAKRATRSMMAKFAVADVVLRAGGWQPEPQAKRRWISWLREKGKCTVLEAREARVRLSSGMSRAPSGRNNHVRTSEELRKLEEQGLIRYVRADSWDPGLVVWIGGDE